jgi:hypothetical protein
MINNKGSITLFWIMIIIMGLLYNFIMLNIPPENSVKLVKCYDRFINLIIFREGSE